MDRKGARMETKSLSNASQRSGLTFKKLSTGQENVSISHDSDLKKVKKSPGTKH